MTDFGDVLGRVKDRGFRRVKTVDLFDPTLIERHAALDYELQRVVQEDTMHNRKPQAPALAQQVADLEAEIADSALTFKFGALSYRQWADILAAHPPTKAQLRDTSERSGSSWVSRPVLDHNPDTFPPALVAACAIEPEMTVDQVKELADELGPDQFELLYNACKEVNRGGETLPKSLAAGVILRASEPSDATPAPEGSLAASS